MASASQAPEEPGKVLADEKGKAEVTSAKNGKNGKAIKANIPSKGQSEEPLPPSRTEPSTTSDHSLPLPLPIKAPQQAESNPSTSCSSQEQLPLTAPLTAGPGPCAESARGSGSNAGGSTADESDTGGCNSINNKDTASPESEDGSGVFSFDKNPASLLGAKRDSAQKSVCFHSLSCTPGGDKKMSSPLDCLQEMINGSTLLKVKASTRQYRRFFTLADDLSAIRWMPSSKKSSKARLPIKSIREVRPGKNTEVLKSREITGAYSEDCIFSVIYGDEFDSLDLVALSPEDANIWVTGLNFLLGASKSPEAMESRQRMREKWLQEVFDEADLDRKGLLDEWETINLMKKLNSQLCIRRLKQKILELDFGKDEEDRGRINRKLFVTLFNETSMRPDIYFLLVRYCGKDYMTVEDVQLFLEGEQGVCGMSLEDCEQVIFQFERSDEARVKKQLLIDGFTQFLLSDDAAIMGSGHKTVCQDMSQPLSHYFISTSHNTYLTEDQLKGPSSAESYAKALRQGCRCLKIDAWDGPSGPDGLTGPVVFHGNTLTSKIPLEDILETINENAFSLSEYPLIIHLENHCSLECQQQMASLFVKIIGSNLYIPNADEPLATSSVSPESLKHKVIIKGKKLRSTDNCEEGQVTDEDEGKECRTNRETLKKVSLCKELSDIVAFSRVRCFDFVVQQTQKENEVCYFSEAYASKLALACAEEVVHHNKSFVTQVAPDMSRIDSSNFNPLDFWNCGCQLVAMNFQTPGQMMDLYRGWFTQNGNSGYVLKPAFLRERFCLFNARRKDSLPGIDPLCLRLKIISGQQLPRPRGASCKAITIDPYVTVQVVGVPADCAEARTRTVSNEGNSPMFEESFEFSVTVPELAMLRFVVLDDEYINDDFIGQCTVPLECAQTGYRHVRLYANNGDLVPNATLFVHITLSSRYGSKQKLRRKRSWAARAHSSDLRSVGLKAVDDNFKTASGLIVTSSQVRRDVELRAIEFTDECSLSEGANIAQCLRVLTLRLASSSAVTSFDIITSEQGTPTIKTTGDVTAKLNKSITAFEKVMNEFTFVSQNSTSTLDSMNAVHDLVISQGEELPNLCTSAGIKGRKADKVAENFMWNLSVLKTEMDILRAIRDDTDCALKQVERLGPALKKLFERERDSLSSSAKHEPFKSVPQVLSGATLGAPDPEPRQPPATPTSPGDGRLRGILKKSLPAPETLADTSSLATNNQEEGDRSDLVEQSSDSSSSSPKLSTNS